MLELIKDLLNYKDKTKEEIIINIFLMFAILIGVFGIGVLIVLLLTLV